MNGKSFISYRMPLRNRDFLEEIIMVCFMWSREGKKLLCIALPLDMLTYHSQIELSFCGERYKRSVDPG